MTLPINHPPVATPKVGVLLVNLGTPDAPTTVSASDILIDRGVTTHGTVWARQTGVVLGAA